MGSRVTMPFKGQLTKSELKKQPKHEQDRMARETAALSKLMSPKGFLAHKLLDKRRLEFGIPDDAFLFQPTGTNVLVWQLTRMSGDKYDADSLIVMTEGRQKIEQESNPAGILVGAGLDALGSLRMNGIDLGHVVTFTKNVPYRYTLGMVCGKELDVLTMHDGDIRGSFDLMHSLRNGTMKVQFDSENYTYYYLDKKGNVWRPQNASLFQSEDG